MQLPRYTGFYFTVAKNPTHRTVWYICKEYAGRTLGARSPKNYVTLTIWNGYQTDSVNNRQAESIKDKAAGLQTYLNNLADEYKDKARFVVSSVDEPGVLQVRVPAAWCNNRLTAHLLLTHLRIHLRPYYNTTDFSHLERASHMLSYGKEVGLEALNVQLKHINKTNRWALGIVGASQVWRRPAPPMPEPAFTAEYDYNPGGWV